MELSARNQLKGTIKAIEVGAVMADITIDIGGDQTLSSAITRQSVERLGLKVGDQVVAIIKATDLVCPHRDKASRHAISLSELPDRFQHAATSHACHQ